ncbi:MAG: hypothetical protein COU27_02785 [Candidatus Levybacteria bacterium CG10_big_fil_rev_8_21_14_0_10_36_7]|nr:MAG: hypothetical protein COU27_02785 [Candidatus Levybacteria bacterium CG10_big_fil_rev_8_21_14_0_10_36_7]
MKKKVFVSFDWHNNRNIKNFVMGQAKLPASPFWGIDYSMREAAPQQSWEDIAERRIKQCDLVLIMVGSKTYQAGGVLKEVAMARKHEIPVAQIIAYKDLMNVTPVPNAGRLYRWSWDNLKELLS